MGKFKQSLITTAGKSILLGGEVTYTTAKLFSQDVSSMTDDQVRALTALTGQLMSVGVSVEVMDNSTVSVKAVFSNKGLTADLTFSSVGWFAKAGSGNETLIAVTPIEGTKLLCAGLPNSSTDAINIAMNMAIGDSTTVNVVIDPAGTVSPVDLGSAISKIQTDVDTKATKADVDKEITTLTADKANSADVYTKSDVDSALAADRGRLGKLEGVQTVDSPDFNNITNTGVYYITNNTPANLKNNPVSQWGVLVVSSGNGQRISQVYYPDDDSPQWCRLLNGSNWLPWYELSNQSDITNLQNAVNSKVNVDGDLFSSPGSINSWADVQADGQKNVLKSVRTEGQATDFDTGNWDAGILFGGNDTKALISVGYQDSKARVTGGNNSAVWHEDIAWKSDITNLQNMIQAQQTKLTDDVYTKTEVDSKVSALNKALTPVYVNSRDDVAAQDAYIVIVNDDN